MLLIRSPAVPGMGEFRGSQRLQEAGEKTARVGSGEPD